MTIIREAGVSDIYNLYKCNRAVLPIFYSVDEYLYFIILSPGKKVLVAEQGDELCGYIVAEQNKSFMHIMSFGVYPEYRRQGIGRKLVDGLIDVIKSDKTINSLSLNVHADNHQAINFYEKCGFKKVNKLINYYNGHLKNVTTQDAYRLEHALKKNN